MSGVKKWTGVEKWLRDNAWLFPMGCEQCDCEVGKDDLDFATETDGLVIEVYHAACGSQIA